MPDFLSKRRTLAINIEAVSGVEDPPAYPAQVVEVENFNPAPDIQTEDRSSNTGALDDPAPLFAGGLARWTWDTLLKGIGIGETGVPRDGAMWRSAAMGEREIAAAIAGTVDAYAAGVITQTSFAIAADGAYDGSVLILTGGAGFDAATAKNNIYAIKRSLAAGTLEIYPHNAAIDGTTTFELPPQTTYLSKSDGLETATIYNYNRSSAVGGQTVVDKSPGSALDFSLAMSPSSSARVSWTSQGRIEISEDLADPGDAPLPPAKPFTWMDARTFFGVGATAVAICPSNLTVAANNRIQTYPCPNEQFGRENAQITGRGVSASVTLPLENIAIRNSLLAALQQETTDFWTAWGPGQNERVSVLLRDMIYNSPARNDVEEATYENLSLSAGQINNAVAITVF